MRLRNIYLKPIHTNAYRHMVKGYEVNGMITGLYNVKPNNCDSFRICYEISYIDGFIDYVPISDVENGSYQIVE